MSQAITINSTAITRLTYQGKAVITLDLIDQVHERPKGTAKRNFSQHRQRLMEGKHYFVRNSYEAQELGVTAPNGLVLLTEAGYLKLVKSFRDDLAWDVQDQLVESYFRLNDATKLPIIRDPALQAIATVMDQVKSLVIEIDASRQAAEQAKADAAHSKDLALQVMHAQAWLPIAQYVILHDLTRQMPLTRQQQYGRYLTGYCLQRGYPVYKTRNLNGWEENTYYVHAIQQTLGPWLAGQNGQLSITAITPDGVQYDAHPNPFDH